VSGQRLAIRYDPEKVPTPYLVSRITGSCPVKGLSMAEPDIEEVIKAIHEGMAGTGGQ
jgi:hypothetical protein